MSCHKNVSIFLMIRKEINLVYGSSGRAVQESRLYHHMCMASLI